MRKLMAIVLASGLLLAACGQSTAPAPTSSGGGATASSGGSSASAGGSAASKPSSPQLTKKLTFVYDSNTGEDDLESLIAFDSLRQQGWDIKNQPVSKNELAVTEVANGQADIGTGSVDSVVQAIDKGAPLVIFWGYKANDWTVVAKSDIKSVQDLTGKKLGIHSLASFTNAMAGYLKDTYHINPQMPIVPGSDVREQAMIKGSLDATFLDLPTQTDLLAKYPDKFHIIWNAGDAVPGLWATVLYAKKDWLQSHQADVEAMLTEFVKTSKHAAQDTNWLGQQATKYFPHDDPKILPKIAQALVDVKVWPTENEWTSEYFGKTLDFFKKYRQLKLAGQADGYATYDLAAKAYADAGK